MKTGVMLPQVKGHLAQKLKEVKKDTSAVFRRNMALTTH